MLHILEDPYSVSVFIILWWDQKPDMKAVNGKAVSVLCTGIAF